MYYYIDGYNLIFSLSDAAHSEKTLLSLRQEAIRYLQKKFALLKLSGTLVFDGSHRRGEESGLSYPSPLIVAYTPKGQSADAYIVDKIHESPHPKTLLVVTNDKGLTLHSRSAGAKTQTNSEFLDSLLHRSKKKKTKAAEPKETQENIDRLLRIFEDRLKNPDTHDF